MWPHLLTLTLLTKISARVVNLDVTRDVDITTQITKEKSVIVLKNYGETPLRTYTFLLTPEMGNYYVEFTNNDNGKLHHSETFNEKNVFTVHLDRIVEKNESYELVAYVFSASDVRPRNKKRTFTENQILFYTGNVYYYSPYKTFSLKVKYICKLDSLCIASYLPHLTESNNLLYTYSNVVPYSVKQMNISFVNNDSIYAITNLQRTIDVSHWGHIKIEDCLTIKNIGSRIVGSYEPQLQSSRPWLHTHLPVTAMDVKYYDEIGNNSKSYMIYHQDYATFKHQARYPLMGGWRASYILQYTVPTYEYLQRGSGFFYLRIRAVDHVVNDGFVERAVVKVLLPEGAIIKKVYAPVWFNVSEEVQVTNLCIFGRKTIVLTGEMLLENHIENLVVAYDFPESWLLKTPLLIAAYLYIVFIFIIAINRLK